MAHNMKIFLFTIICLILFMLGWLSSSERNRAAFGSYGYTEQGQKFGVQIGSDRQNAIDFLINRGLIDISTLGFVKETSDDPQSCLGRKYANDTMVDILWDRSWRQGTICLASKSDVIVSVSWQYNMFAP